MLRGIADALALTSVERRALTFLSAAFIVGLGIRLYQSEFASPPKFDYRASDSTFAALSAAADDTTAGTMSGSSEPPIDPPGQVDLNTATVSALTALPGVGPATARRIIAERDTHGPFRSVRDLRRVKGLGAKRIEQLSPLVTVK